MSNYQPKHAAASNTPNVVVANPVVRKIANIVLGVAGFITTVGMIVDGAITEIDFGYILNPATAIILGIASLFQLAVTTPNVPTD